MQLPKGTKAMGVRCREVLSIVKESKKRIAVRTMVETVLDHYIWSSLHHVVMICTFFSDRLEWWQLMEVALNVKCRW